MLSLVHGVKCCLPAVEEIVQRKCRVSAQRAIFLWENSEHVISRTASLCVSCETYSGGTRVVGIDLVPSIEGSWHLRDKISNSDRAAS